MPTSPASARKPRISIGRASHKAQSWVGSRLMHVVVGTLLVNWTAVSLLVYLAERDAPEANIKSLGDAFWWGIVTFLTVGYGDRFPVTASGRVLAAFLMLTGVAVTAIVTSKIASRFLERALREGRGVVDTS